MHHLSALDPFLRQRMREELKRLQRDLGITFIHVTHSQDEALALADLVVVMQSGRILQSAPPRDVFQHPSTVFVARFMGGHNILPPGPHWPTQVAVRTDRMRLDGTHPYQLPGHITAVEYHGLHIRLGLEDPAGTAHSILLSEADYHAHPVALGDHVVAGFGPDDLHPLAT